MTIEEYQSKYKFTRNEQNKILVKPLGAHSFRTSQVDNTFIVITDEEFIGLVTRKKQFNKGLNQVIDFIKTAI